MRYAYPAIFSAEPEGGFGVLFPDVPEAITQGEDEAEARMNARDALVTALGFYTDAGQPVPKPSRRTGAVLIVVPALVAAKLELHRAKLESGLTNVELGRRIGADERQVRRLLDPGHKSHIGFVEAALRVLGRELEVAARPVAA